MLAHGLARLHTMMLLYSFTYIFHHYEDKTRTDQKYTTSTGNMNMNDLMYKHQPNASGGNAPLFLRVTRM